MTRGGLIALGVAATLCVALALALVGGGRGEDRAAAVRPGGGASTQVLAASGGVRPAEVDPARRERSAEPHDEQVPAVMRDEPEEAQARGEGGGAPVVEEAPPQAPPIEPTAEQRAADAAYTEVRERVAAEVGTQLAAQRSALARACPGGEGEFSVSASFDAAGALLAMGISEVGAADGARGQCLRSQAIALSVAPGELGVTVDVPLRLP